MKSTHLSTQPTLRLHLGRVTAVLIALVLALGSITFAYGGTNLNDEYTYDNDYPVNKYTCDDDYLDDDYACDDDYPDNDYSCDDDYLDDDYSCDDDYPDNDYSCDDDYLDDDYACDDDYLDDEYSCDDDYLDDEYSCDDDYLDDEYSCDDDYLDDDYACDDDYLDDDYACDDDYLDDEYSCDDDYLDDDYACDDDYLDDDCTCDDEYLCDECDDETCTQVSLFQLPFMPFGGFGGPLGNTEVGFFNDGAMWPSGGERMYFNIPLGASTEINIHSASPGLPVRAGYTLIDWSGDRDEPAGWGFSSGDGTTDLAPSTVPELHNNTVDNPQPTTQWRSGLNPVPTHYHYPMFLFLSLLSEEDTTGWIGANFEVLQLQMDDININTDYRQGTPTPNPTAVANDFNATNFVTDAEVSNLLNNTIAPLEFRLPQDGAFSFHLPGSTGLTSVSGSAYHITTNFINSADSFDIPIIPRANLGPGTHIEYVRTYQRGYLYTFNSSLSGNSRFGFEDFHTNSAFPLARLADPTDTHAFNPSVTLDSVQIRVEFTVLRPATGITIQNPSAANTVRNAAIDFGTYALESGPRIGNTAYATLTSNYASFVSTVYNDENDPDQPDIVITLSLTCEYSFFAYDSTNNNMAMTTTNPITRSPLTDYIVAPSGYTVVSAHVDNNGRLLIRLTPPPPQPNNYTITFNLNNGYFNNSPNPVTVNRTQGYDIGLNNVPIPTRNGYTFADWLPAGEADTIDRTEVGNTLVTGNKTFIAQWTPLPNYHTITFNLNGGQFGSSQNPVTVDRQQGSNIGLNNVPYPVIKAGYEFVGWLPSGATDPISSVNVGSTPVTGPMIFTAQWVPQSAVPSPSPPEETPSPSSTPQPPPGETPAPSSSQQSTPDPENDPDPEDDSNTETTAGNPNPRPRHEAYLIGFDDGTIRPNSPITRGQVATAFFRLLEHPARETNWTRNNSFNDVNINHWFNNPISVVSRMDIMVGFPEGDFRPDMHITRAETAAVLVRFIGEPLHTSQAMFADINGHWAMHYINTAAHMGWIMGPTGLGGNFYPDTVITRAEFVAMVNRMLNRVPCCIDNLLPNMRMWVDNMDRNRWYFMYIQEATNTHYYIMCEENGEIWVSLEPSLPWYRLELPDSVPADLFR